MGVHRITKSSTCIPKLGEIVLVLGEEKNRGKWKRGKVRSHVKGSDGVVRGVTLLHKGHTIERPLQAVCPLEIRSCIAEEVTDERVEEAATEETSNERKPKRSERNAAMNAAIKTKMILEDDEID